MVQYRSVPNRANSSTFRSTALRRLRIPFPAPTNKTKAGRRLACRGGFAPIQGLVTEAPPIPPSVVAASLMIQNFSNAQRDVACCRVGPGEFHPEPLTDPDVNLSIHSGSCHRTEAPPSADVLGSSQFDPVGPSQRRSPAPFAPRALPRFITTTGQCAPSPVAIGTFGLAVVAACAFSLLPSPARFSRSIRKPS